MWLSPIPLLHVLSFLCSSRENNGKNNILFQEKAAVNLQIAVSIRVVTRVGFLLSPGIAGLYPGFLWSKGYRRDQS